MKTLNFEWHEDVAIISLNRPQKANAIDWDMFEEFPKLVSEVAADERTRAIVVRGEGNSFCAGPDKSSDTPFDSHDVMERSPEIQRKYYRRWGKFVAPLFHAEQPTVALINGWCAGEGYALGTVCDFRIGTPGTKFMTDVGRVGGLDVVGLLWSLTQLVGRSRALDLFLTGRTIEGTEAERIGLLNRLTSDELLLTDGLAFADDLASLPPISTKLNKQLLKQTMFQDFDRTLDMVSFMAANVELSEDHQEAFKAYEAGRPLPKYKGR